jgi:putative ABC transport system ATP-binding protein
MNDAARKPVDTEAVVRMDQVVKVYDDDGLTVKAIDGITLAIPRRRFTMIVGPSGSGKTTLLNLMGCIDSATSGTVEVCGEDVAKLSDNAVSDFRAKNVGFIFQNFSLVPVLTAYENIEYPLLLLNLPAAERKKRTMAMLEGVGLAEHWNHRPNQLSGGQRQRVAIARALVKEPEIVLADEPTANLDSHTGASIVELMQRQQHERNTTFIFSTHDPHLMSYAHETFAIKDGAVVDHTMGAAS